MAKKSKKKKFYAIKEGKNNTKDLIVDTWDECKKLVHGYPSVYKSFPTKEECKEYLNTVNAEKIKAQTKKGIEHKKKIRSTTKPIQIRVSNEMYNDLQKKCEELHLSIESVVKFALTDYLY